MTRALAADPAKRHADARALADELAGFLDHARLATAPPDTPRSLLARCFDKWRTSAVIVAAALALGGVMVALDGPDPNGAAATCRPPEEVAVLALDLPGLGRRVLSGVVSLVTQPRVDLIACANLEAAAVLWSDGLTWFARVRDGLDAPLSPGESLAIEGQAIPIVSVTVDASDEVTTVDPASLESALHVTVRADLVRADHSGNFELFLAHGDRVDDQT